VISLPIKEDDDMKKVVEILFQKVLLKIKIYLIAM
jgi:hypothetical protein